MDELTLATIDSPDCRVSEHIAILIASGDAPEIDIESRVVDGFSEALQGFHQWSQIAYFVVGCQHNG